MFSTPGAIFEPENTVQVFVVVTGLNDLFETNYSGVQQAAGFEVYLLNPSVLKKAVHTTIEHTTFGVTLHQGAPHKAIFV